MGVKRRREVLPAAIGLATGALVVGLVLPFAIGESAPTTAASGSPRSASGTPLSTTTTSVPGAGGAAITSSGSGSSPGSSTGTTPGGSSQAGQSTAAGPLRASDRGVSATSVKVGFLLVDVGGGGRFGFSFQGVDPAQQRRAFDAFVGDINARGGINGRSIEPAYRTFNVLDDDDMRTKCIELTQDEGVFAVLAQGGFTGSPMLCVTVDNKTPLIALSEVTNEYLERSEGRLVTFNQVGNRMMANLAHELHTTGALKGKTIGVLDDRDGTDQATDGGLIPTLKQLGYSVAHVSRLPADLSGAAGQVPVEVQQMRGKGVDLVIISTNTVAATQFVQTAEAQRWDPQWVASDWRGNTTDSVVQNMPAAFDGAIAVTQTRTGEWRDNLPEPAPDVSCREDYERASKESLRRSNDGTTANGAYISTMHSCDLIRAFEAAARLAGPELTRASYIDAVQRVGPFAAAWRLGGSFGPRKFDAPDGQRILRYRYDCKCWRVGGPIHPSAY